jgi:hypothetical protein
MCSIAVPLAISQALSAAKSLAPKNQFQPRFQIDDPCPDLAKKIFRFGFTPNQWLHLAIPPRAEGRFAIVTDVEAGSGGRERSQHPHCWPPRQSPAKIFPVQHVPQREAVPARAVAPVSISSFEWSSQPLNPECCDDHLNPPVSSAEPVVLPRAFLLHADHGCRPVPGLPCALSLSEGLRLQSSDAAGAARMRGFACLTFGGLDMLLFDLGIDLTWESTKISSPHPTVAMTARREVARAISRLRATGRSVIAAPCI